MGYLLNTDSINGKSGTAIMTKNGRNIPLFQLKKIEVNAEFQESDFKVVGTKLVQKKTTGVTQTGTMDVYYGSPEFLAILKEYQESGKLPVLSIQITNDDPTATIGKQTVALYGVKLQKIPIAMLDADADFLTSSIPFSFTSVEVLNAFNNPETLGSN